MGKQTSRPLFLRTVSAIKRLPETRLKIKAWVNKGVRERLRLDGWEPPYACGARPTTLLEKERRGPDNAGPDGFWTRRVSSKILAISTHQRGSVGTL